jgi:hypothetical protein
MKQTKAVVDLKYPIPASDDCEGAEEIKQITFGRLKVKHLKAMPEKMMDPNRDEDAARLTAVELIPIIAVMAGLTENQAGEIDIEDLEKISEVIADFFEQYQGIGRVSSGE